MFLFHHIIIIMDIDDDMMDAILNNQQKSGRPWIARMRMVSEVAGLNGNGITAKRIPPKIG
jgi:hypothetical protein